MEENKFEKHIQQKMNELSIQPSDTAWEKIEARIEKKKHSRWVLFFLFLLFCAFLSGGYWLWNTGQRTVLESKSSEKNNLKQTTNEISAKENKNSPKINNVIPDSVNEKNNKIENAVVTKIAKKNSSQHYTHSTAAKINSEKKGAKIFSEEKETSDIISEKTINKPETVPFQKIQSTNEKIYEEKKDSSYKKINRDSLQKQFFPDAMAKEKDTSTKAQAIAGVVKHKNKWKTGILFSVGISNVGNNVLNTGSSSSYAQNATPPGSVTGRLYNTVNSKNGSGFIIGVVEEKNITIRTKISFGLNYKSFRTSNSIIDSAALFNTNKYINHFNFIEFPISIKIQIGKGKSIPLFWQGGFVISQLISSNALQFNSASGYYYKDNSIFNKTQIGFNTAFYASLFAKHKNSILIGPYLYYGASNIANEGLYNKKHFVFAGLRTEIIFGK